MREYKFRTLGDKVKLAIRQREIACAFSVIIIPQCLFVRVSSVQLKSLFADERRLLLRRDIAVGFALLFVTVQFRCSIASSGPPRRCGNFRAQS